MKKENFYIFNFKKIDYLFEKHKIDNIKKYNEKTVFLLKEIETLDKNLKSYKFVRVLSILVDRIIWTEELNFLVSDEKKFEESFIEIDKKYVQKHLDNTKFLLGWDIFRR
jgi:hypothetical protein